MLRGRVLAVSLRGIQGAGVTKHPDWGTSDPREILADVQGVIDSALAPPAPWLPSTQGDFDRLGAEFKRLRNRLQPPPPGFAWSTCDAGHAIQAYRWTRGLRSPTNEPWLPCIICEDVKPWCELVAWGDPLAPSMARLVACANEAEQWRVLLLGEP